MYLHRKFIVGRNSLLDQLVEHGSGSFLEGKKELITPITDRLSLTDPSTLISGGCPDIPGYKDPQIEVSFENVGLWGELDAHVGTHIGLEVNQYCFRDGYDFDKSEEIKLTGELVRQAQKTIRKTDSLVPPVETMDVYAMLDDRLPRLARPEVLRGLETMARRFVDNLPIEILKCIFGTDSMAVLNEIDYRKNYIFSRQDGRPFVCQELKCEEPEG